MKVKPYKETHMDGVISIEDDPFLKFISAKDRQYPFPGYCGRFHRVNQIKGDFGIQIAEDGRVWICIDGVAFIRFVPSNKYHTVGSKLNPEGEKELC